ncbi:MAG: TrmH family RNA methyltransferase [Patescibacteria group bacterium]
MIIYNGNVKEIILILCDIRSIHNVGSIFRTADAASVEKIYLCGITPSPRDRFGKFRRDFAKVSLGAEKSVVWIKMYSAVRAIKELRDAGYAICAVEQSKRSIPYYKMKAGNKKIALVLGNEVKGLPRSILKCADKILEIPMSGAKESLNVAVAAGIVLFRMRYL